MLCWFKSLDIHRACIMLCVCFYLKLILRIKRFRICRIIVTHQDKAWDKNKLITNNFFRIQLRSWNCFGIFNLVRSAGSIPWDNGGPRSSRPLDKGGTRSPKKLFFHRVPPLAATGPFGHYRKKTPQLYSPQWVVHLSPRYSHVTLVSGYPFCIWQLSIDHNMDVHNQVKHRFYMPCTPS